jgi:hypothetical protein
MIGFGKQQTLSLEDDVRRPRTEDVRPGDRLVLVDEMHRQVVVRGRDRRKRRGVNWKVVAWIWIAASVLHLLGHYVQL